MLVGGWGLVIRRCADVHERGCFGGAYGHPPRAMPCHSGSLQNCLVPLIEMALKWNRRGRRGRRGSDSLLSAPRPKRERPWACVAHHQTQVDLTVSGECLRFSSVPRDLFPSNGEGQEGDG